MKMLISIFPKLEAKDYRFNSTNVLCWSH